MSIRFVLTVLMFALSLFSVACSVAAEVSVVRFEQHELFLTIDVPVHTAQIADEGTFEVHQGWNLFYLNRTALIDTFLVDNLPIEYTTVALSDTASLSPEFRSSLPELDQEGEPLLVMFQSAISGSVPFRIVFRGTFDDDVADARFSRENVGREVSGTILEQGAYFSPSSFYYPQGEETSFQCVVSVDIPSNWESVSDGNRLGTQTTGERKEQTWENPFQSDGVMLMAAPYVKRSKWLDSIEVVCLFFEADTGLIGGYLDASVEYLRMYSKLIGPYPYRRFTVAENFFPTGYGMPAWTLLGQQVIRLPFIIGTSLGHEVLHNWWGNNVYVDYERGNWCEAATVYGADYRYKLQQSPAAARDYRKNILKQYVSYVSEENDFPIREFTSRTSPGTRTIGYNKAMMVFHMIEEIIGTDAFFAAWKRIYSDYGGQYIAWEEWLGTFEKTSGADLSYVITQWIDRAGAPVIDVRVDDNLPDSDGLTNTITFTLLENSEQPYRLKVPLQFAGDDLTLDTFVVLNSPESTYAMTVSSGATTMEVDPQCDLFRKLYADEIEPIVSSILGSDQHRFVSFDSEPGDLHKQFGSFGENMVGDTVIILSSDVLHDNGPDDIPVILNPTELSSYLDARVQHVGDSVLIDGKAYPKDGHTFILTGQDWLDIGMYMVIMTDDGESLPRIGQLVPHYGKYSYLVFSGARNIGKGNWTVEKSPLKKEL